MTWFKNHILWINTLTKDIPLLRIEQKMNKQDDNPKHNLQTKLMNVPVCASINLI
jgi:hypothetical protein